MIEQEGDLVSEFSQHCLARGRPVAIRIGEEATPFERTDIAEPAICIDDLAPLPVSVTAIKAGMVPRVVAQLHSSIHPVLEAVPTSHGNRCTIRYA